MSLLHLIVVTLLRLLFGLVVVGIPALCGAAIALNWDRDRRRQLRLKVTRLTDERNGALRALAVIGQVQTNPPAPTHLMPVSPDALATSPVRVLRRLSAVVDIDHRGNGGPVSSGRPVVVGDAGEADGSR